MHSTDTIAAIITAPGRAAVSIIRISGDRVFDLVTPIYHGKADLANVPSHTVHYGWIIDPETEKRLDEVLVLVMRAPNSYTGENVIEIQCHGGYMAVSEVLRLLFRGGARPAEPGEFSRRAFLNGKLDLTRAEAVMDLVDAPGNEALQLAAAQKSGNLATKIQALREEAITLVAYLQADLDYPEDDIERLTRIQYQNRVSAMRDDIQALIRGAERGRLFHDGVRVVIAGRPNVGKSSLLNALLGRERAIVTDIPGTTRDIVQDRLTIRGLPIEILDTAGIRDTGDTVERIGVDLAKASLREADVVLYLLDHQQGEHPEDTATLAECPDLPVLHVYNKSDLGLAEIPHRKPYVVLSAKTGEGLENLTEQVFDMVVKDTAPNPTGITVTNVRHLSLLQQVDDVLRSFEEGLTAEVPEDLLVIDLQTAWELLGLLTGETADDNLIDEIFSRFCLGK